MRSIINRTKNRLARLRAEHAATDPILVIAGITITLVLLIGGSFMITQMITNAKDLNASSDLDKIAVAESGYFATNDQFVAYGSFGKNAPKALEDSSIGFKPTDGASVVVVLNAGGGAEWAAASQSASNDKTIFIRTSESNKTIKLPTSHVATATELAATQLNAADVTSLVTKVQAEK